MLVEINQTSHLLKLAKEAQEDYMTARMDRRVTAATIVHHRDAMVFAMRALTTHLSHYWPEMKALMEGALHVPAFENSEEAEL